MVLLSVLLPTYNSQATIRNTLASVCWADEIFVVDSFSTDKTLDICREYGCRIIQHEYITSAKQKDWALPQCTHDWVLQIDTDEGFEDGSNEVILRAINSADSSIGAFRFPRKNHMLGKWQRFGGNYPDYQTRLLRRDACHWQDKEVHAHIVCEGRIETLGAHILHDNMPTITRELRNLDRYSRYGADELRKQNRSFRVFDLCVRPGLAFGYRYIWQQGFRDGLRGLIAAVQSSTYVFFTRSKLWELDELKIDKSP